MVAVLVVGVVITFTFYYFSGTKRSFNHGHIFVLVTYIGFVFVLIADYAKRVDLVPKKYRQQLKENKLHELELSTYDCSKFKCLEHIENTYSITTWITKITIRAKIFPIGMTLPIKLFRQSATGRPDSTKTRKIQKKTATKRNISYRTYSLYVYDFFIKAAFNCCASDNFRNAYVNIESMNLAILMGCRFLDFEVYTSTAPRASPRRPIRITSTIKSRLTTSTSTTCSST